MKFDEKYTNDPENTKKQLVSDDCYALGDVIQQLVDKIEHLRLAAIR